MNYEKLDYTIEEERFVLVLMHTLDVNDFELLPIEMRDLAIDFFNYWHNISQ